MEGERYDNRDLRGDGGSSLGGWEVGDIDNLPVKKRKRQNRNRLGEGLKIAQVMDINKTMMGNAYPTPKIEIPEPKFQANTPRSDGASQEKPD